MVNTRLLLVNEQNSPSTYLDNVPQYQDQTIKTTYQITDIRNPDFAEVSKTATFKIPGTAEVNKFFENVYDVNISLSTFNPNLKVKAYYYIDELLAFEGHLQIIDMDVDEVEKKVSYNCNILGEVGTLMTKIKDNFLTELDFSAYNHTLTYANIVASWTSSLGVGYKYPLVDWGINNSNMLQVKPEHFRACIHKREILAKIFAAAGYSWTSTFLDSTEFKSRIEPPTSLPVLNSSVLNNNKFLAVSTGAQTWSNVIAHLGLGQLYSTFTSWTTLQYPTETYDAGGHFDNTTFYTFTPTVSNKYNIAIYQALNVVLRDSTAADVSSTVQYTGTTTNIQVQIIDSNGLVVKGTNSLTNLDFSSGNSNAINVIINNIDLIAGHPYYVRLRFTAVELQVFPYVNVPFTLHTTNVSGSNFSASFASTSFYEGASVVMNDLIPVDYKQSEFISNLRKEYNLQFLADKDNPNNIIIEPYPTFYSTTPRNFTFKHDKASEVKVFPMGELDFNRMTCTHSEDGDFYNKEYLDEYKNTYGTYVKEIENDFIKGDKVIQPTIAATPYALNPATGLVVPTIVNKNNGLTSPIKIKPRSWHWGGLINLPTGVSWNFVHTGGTVTVTYNTLPSGGHTDNPWNPTLDLCFDEPNRVYYNYPNLQWTNNNLYNRYYSQYVNQITDKNSKIIKTKFALSPLDIFMFDFRYPIFTIINGEQGYYLVNRIEEYDPLQSESTLVELLKLTDYPIFTPTVSDYNNDNDDKNQNRANNTNYSPTSEIIGGNDNFIAAKADNAVLINSQNVNVDSTVDNFTAINLTTAKEIDNTYDNLTVIGNYLAPIKPSVKAVTADFTIDGKYSHYEINLDTIGVAITCTWDLVAYPVQIVFKIVSNTSGVSFIINESSSPSPSPSPLIDGNSFPFTTGLVTYESLTVYSNGTNLYII